MSVVWWRSLHQEATVLRPGAPTIAGSMLGTLLLAVLAFTLAYTYLMVVRLRVGRVEDRAATTILSTPTRRARSTLFPYTTGFRVVLAARRSHHA